LEIAGHIRAASDQPPISSKVGVGEQGPGVIIFRFPAGKQFGAQCKAGAGDQGAPEELSPRKWGQMNRHGFSYFLDSESTSAFVLKAVARFLRWTAANSNGVPAK
jgi:hypothetical protein